MILHIVFPRYLLTGTPLTEILLKEYAYKNENEVYKIFDKIYEEIIRLAGISSRHHS